MKQKSTSRFLLDGFFYILVFPFIIPRARGEENRALYDLPKYSVDYYLPDQIKDQHQQVVTVTARLNNYNEYPYEELLSFVKETKRILQSSYSVDKERRKILEKNFGTRYSNYLTGDNSDIKCPHPIRFCPPTPVLELIPPLRSPFLGPLPPLPVSYSPARPIPRPSISTGLFHYPMIDFGDVGFNNTIVNVSMESDAPRAPVPDRDPVVVNAEKRGSSCQQITRLYRPQRLKSVDGKEHFILNLGNEFIQEIKVVQCRNYQTRCGDPSKWPEAYEQICEQSYDSYKTLFSVPVNEKINLLDQNLYTFKVASGCLCSLKKKQIM